MYAYRDERRRTGFRSGERRTTREGRKTGSGENGKARARRHETTKSCMHTAAAVGAERCRKRTRKRKEGEG